MKIKSKPRWYKANVGKVWEKIRVTIRRCKWERQQLSERKRGNK